MYNNMMIRETQKAKFLPSVWLECLIFFLLFWISQILQVIILLIPTIFEMLKNPDNIQEIIASPTVRTTSLFSTVMVIIIVIIYCKLIQKRSLASLGIVKANAVKHYLLGCLLGLLFSAVVYTILFLFGCVGSITNNGFHISVFMLFFAFIVQSASEELLMRGYLMNSIAAKSKVPLAIFLNSFLFMMLHLLNPGVTFISMLNILIYGVIFSLLCLLTDNIWLACGMHFSWNFALGCIYGGNVSGITLNSLFSVTLKGNDILTGSDFGIEGSIITTLIGLLIVLILGYCIKTNRTKISPVRENHIEK